MEVIEPESLRLKIKEIKEVEKMVDWGQSKL